MTLQDDGSAVVVWDDQRHNWDVYAQALDAQGHLLWPAEIRANSSSTAYGCTIAGDGAGGTFVAWKGETNVLYESDVYMRRFDADGNALWNDLRVNSDTALATQELPTLARLQSGAVAVSWQDERNGDQDVYVQLVNGEGSRLWQPDHNIVSPDRFYLPSGVAQSRAVDATDDPITKAILILNGETNGGAIAMQLSNDGGAHWAAVLPDVTNVFHHHRL